MSTSITDRAAQVLQQIDAALALAEKATPGPWHSQNPSYRVYVGNVKSSPPIAEMLTHTSHERDTDATFIAASRTLLPASLRCLKTAIEGLLEIYDATDGYDTADVVLTALLNQWEATK